MNAKTRFKSTEADTDDKAPLSITIRNGIF